MSVQYASNFDRLSGQLVEVVGLARSAMVHVAAAVYGSEHAIEGSLQEAEKALRALRRGIEDQALAIQTSRDWPTVADLRTIIVAAHVNADADRIADLMRPLGEIARSRPSRPPVPARLQDIVYRMGQCCVEMTAVAGDAVASSARADAVAEAQTANAEVSRLQQLLYRLILTGAEAVDVDAAVDLTLASRYYVRCAEHTVSIVRHAALLWGRHRVHA
jgi:phosphate transport system protein